MSRRRAAAAVALLLAAAAFTVGRADAAFLAVTANPGNTLGAAASFPTYPQAVVAASPSRYHRLGEATATGMLADTLDATRTAYLDTGYTFGRPGVTGDGDQAVQFHGATGHGSSGWLPSVASRSSVNDPQNFTVECWFATTTTRGGELIGFGSQRKTDSSTYDRALYMTDAGGLVFGVYSGSAQVVSSAGPYNDGAWHHAAASFGAGGVQLYVDGVLTGTNLTPPSAQHFTGYWRVGGDRISGWPSSPNSNGFEGRIDEVAVYPSQLTQARLAAHIAAAPGTGYAASVASDSPYLHWRMHGDATTAAADAGGQGHPGVFAVRPYRTPAQSGGAAVFTGGTEYITGRRSIVNPAETTVECWFTTTTTDGGRLIGLSESRTTAVSAKSDRHLYLTDAGKVVFGAGTNTVVQSPLSYNDGLPHHVAGSVGPAGLKLYVDGALVASNAGVTAGQVLTGFWRAGGDNLNGWPGEPTNPFFTGTVEEAAAFTTQLSDAAVAAHFGGGAVLADTPALYWRLDDADFAAGATDSGTLADTGTASAPRFVAGVAGPMTGGQTPATALRFAGTGNAWLPARLTNPSPFTIECWFRTSTTTGGVIANFGSLRVGTSGNRDRFLYLSDNGRLNFGVYTGTTKTVQTTTAWNDGLWHHVVASSGPAGLRLAVDGKVRAFDAAVTTAENMTGSWRVGGDGIGGWPGASTSAFYTGDLAEFAVYPAQLTDQQMREHFAANH